jgi:hypothetical protein
MTLHAIPFNQTQTQPVGQDGSSRSGKRAAREILLLCATANVSPANKVRITQLLSKTVDWGHLLELAQFHGMLPLVTYNLTTNGLFPQVPKTYSERLNQAYNGSLYRNLILSTELENVLAAFSKKEIAVIVLKGTVLAEQLYGNPGLRTVTDMDILVRPEEITSADSLLLEMGYTKLINEPAIVHPFHDVYQKRAIMPFFIELHWNLDDQKLVTVPLRDIWQRAQIIEIQGGTTRTLSPEDAIVHLSNNLSKPSGRLLRNLCDITELLKKHGEALNWDYFIKSVHSWGIEAGVYYSLKRSMELFKAPVPATVVTTLKPGLWRRWALTLLINRESFLLPIKWDQLRTETSTIVRCLTMRGTRHMLAVLSKYRGHRKRAGWLRTAFWVILVFGAALEQNIVKAVSRW